MRVTNHPRSGSWKVLVKWAFDAEARKIPTNWSFGDPVLDFLVWGQSLAIPTLIQPRSQPGR